MTLSPPNPSQLQEIADLIRNADTVFILAGAGLSTSLGIPAYWSQDGSYGDKTSKHGYTALQHSNAQLWMQDTASQIAYFSDKQAEFAKIDFRSSIYGTLLSAVKEKEYFCVTSNVDSGFYRAGFAEEKLFEVHGSHRNSQCVMDPDHGVFASPSSVSVCKVCSMPTRPNVLFFNDNSFNPSVLLVQQDRFNRFMEQVEGQGKKAVILELGVGDTVPRIRQFGNRLYRDLETAHYLHVNLEPEPEFLFGQSCAFENREQWLQMSAEDFIIAI